MDLGCLSIHNVSLVMPMAAGAPTGIPRPKKWGRWVWMQAQPPPPLAGVKKAKKGNFSPLTLILGTSCQPAKRIFKGRAWRSKTSLVDGG